MASNTEPWKLLQPYLQRAEELEKHEPLVAYYCRLYAMEKGMRIPAEKRTKDTNMLLTSIIKRLEKDKKVLSLSSEDNLHIEGFASRVFARADKQDRSGRADLNTAKTFYAASMFFEILDQFGPLPPELEQQQKYALWKAADIRKALKEGRKPSPGPPDGDDELPDQPSTINGVYDVSASGPPVLSTQDEITSSSLPKTFSSSHDAQEANQHSDRISSQAHRDDLVNDQSAARDMGSTTSVSGSHSQPYQPPLVPSGSDHSASIHPYHHQSFSQGHAHHSPQDLPTNDPVLPSYSNFQSYPSFAESSFPSAPSHPPTFYQDGETHFSYSGVPVTRYSPHVQYSPNDLVPRTSPPSIQSFQNDGNYEPTPEKIAEAQKAARFAVGSLAFDDVSSAVEYLKKSLNLLTNPSAGH